MRYHDITHEEDLQFKEIPGFSNYLVCSNGEIYSKISNKFMSCWKNQKGYKVIRLRADDGEHHQIVVHRVVAMQFIPNPYCFPQVNHKDEDKNNNSVDNLEWCTNLYNCQYGTRGKRISIANKGKRAKPILMFDSAWNYIKEYPSQEEAWKDGYTQANVSKVIRGEREFVKGMRFVRKDEFENAISQYRKRIDA